MTYTAEEVEALFAWEESAYTAAVDGRDQDAIDVWSQILGNTGYYEYFTDDALKEMAFNLSACYYLAGKEDDCRDTLGKWSIADRFDEIEKAVKAQQ